METCTYCDQQIVSDGNLWLTIDSNAYECEAGIHVPRDDTYEADLPDFEEELNFDYEYSYYE